MISTLDKVGKVVAQDFRTAAVFNKFNIDFCCGGGVTIDEICKRKNLNTQEIMDDLNKAVSGKVEQYPDFNNWDLDLLVDYIEKKHHRFVRENIPHIKQFLSKLCKVHGPAHGELYEIFNLFEEGASSLVIHMQKEEKILFPAVRNICLVNQNEGQDAYIPNGSIERPISVMLHEHDTEGDRFKAIAVLSNNYQTPPDGCTTYRVTYEMLRAFENDLHMHIHLENNIIFPKALELERKLKA